MKNALNEYLKKQELENKISISTLDSLLREECETNPLLDPNVKYWAKVEEEYLTAEELYKAYIDLKSYMIAEIPKYSEGVLLEWTQIQLGERYKAFYNVYLRGYKDNPLMSTDEYLYHFKFQMKRLSEKLEFGWFNKGFTTADKKIVKESMHETVLYLKSIGQWKLADEVLSHITEPLKEPKLPKKIKAKMIETHTVIMHKKCKISKKEAKKLLKNTISKLF